MTEYAHHLQKKFFASLSGGSGEDGSGMGLLDDDEEDMLGGGGSTQHENHGANTGGMAASGWRREMHEVPSPSSFSIALS
jgi:hypothetical protein